MERAGATPTSGSRSTRSMKTFWAFALSILASASGSTEVPLLTIGIDVNDGVARRENTSLVLNIETTHKLKC